MRAGLALLLVAATADARPGWSRLGGGAQLHYDITTLHDVEHPAGEPASPQDLVLAGARLHGFVGGKRFGYHLGLDLAAGQTARPHSVLAYDVALFPVGLALRFAETSFITVGAGIGAFGAVGTLDDRATYPLEARVEIGRGTRLLGRVRTSYVDPGSALEAMLGLRIGDAYNEYGYPTGNGYFLGASYRELLGARFAGITLGFSLDMGTPRTRRRFE